MNREALVTMKEDSFPRQQLGTEFARPEASPFDALASTYDACLEDEGTLISVIEAKAFQKALLLLP
ncbi:MAG: hypothetical protein H8E40_12325, partial [Chloroflexi bacterium]|nr:hypothetical protein [Chloroflexota bacterium]